MPLHQESALEANEGRAFDPDQAQTCALRDSASQPSNRAVSNTALARSPEMASEWLFPLWAALLRSLAQWVWVGSFGSQQSPGAFCSPTFHGHAPADQVGGSPTAPAKDPHCYRAAASGGDEADSARGDGSLPGALPARELGLHQLGRSFKGPSSDGASQGPPDFRLSEEDASFVSRCSASRLAL